jgi:hypothetical protein
MNSTHHAPHLTVDVRSPLTLKTYTVATLPQTPVTPVTSFTATSPYVRAVFESALDSPGSSLSSSPVFSEVYNDIRGATAADTRRIVCLQRELRESELRLQQAGRLGMELHQENDRLRRGIDILQQEYDSLAVRNDIDSSSAGGGIPDDKESLTHSLLSMTGLKAMQSIRGQNTLLQARNQSLNTHCEEADMRTYCFVFILSFYFLYFFLKAKCHNIVVVLSYLVL